MAKATAETNALSHLSKRLQMLLKKRNSALNHHVVLDKKVLLLDIRRLLRKIVNTIAGDESESLSDINDTEVEGYLHNEEEKHYKRIIWEEMSKEYIEEQAAKEAVAAAANLRNCPVEAQELALLPSHKETKLQNQL
ncbi:transcription factor IIIB 60 kDa subunit-like [Papaver somniferum]|uniref:transcription factor IIIB 60 kDa subunit-like n=1 Tax=Papaver somniferum TaxID=3469 RepID=UPI000E6FBEAF|nr:transcription factor IIIB 60 kDa subunit-like [Papaver somniferum]